MILKIAMVQFSPVLGDIQKNLKEILSFIDRAHDENCGLVTFPENALTGYFLRDLVSEVTQPLDSDIIKEIKTASKSIDILLGFVEQQSF